MELLSKKQIILAEYQLADAMKKHDVEILDKLIHDDLVFHTPDGSVITKTIDLEAHRSGAMVIESIISSGQKISLFDDTAIVSVLVETKGEMLGQPVAGKFRYIRTWKSINGMPKIIAGSCIQVL
jgi:hypothetical protein